VDSKDKTDQKQHNDETNTVREAHENTLKARDEEETHTSVDRKKTGNRPRFDRDR
jgi:hypothetical protein